MLTFHPSDLIQASERRVRSYSACRMSALLQPPLTNRRAFSSGSQQKAVPLFMQHTGADDVVGHRIDPLVRRLFAVSTDPVVARNQEQRDVLSPASYPNSTCTGLSEGKASSFSTM